MYYYHWKGIILWHLKGAKDRTEKLLKGIRDSLVEFVKGLADLVAGDKEIDKIKSLRKGAKAAGAADDVENVGSSVEVLDNLDDVVDRYGSANGRYTSPVINGNSFSYTERSLPYVDVEDLSNYHQCDVVGDFTKIKEYVGNCTDTKLKMQIEATVNKYYKGDYSRLVSYKGKAVAVEGWGKGENV